VPPQFGCFCPILANAGCPRNAADPGGPHGAPVGKHVVTVHCRRPPTPEEKRNLVIPESLIPEKYSRQDESPLRFEVQEGHNEYPIELE